MVFDCLPEQIFYFRFQIILRALVMLFTLTSKTKKFLSYWLSRSYAPREGDADRDLSVLQKDSKPVIKCEIVY